MGLDRNYYCSIGAIPAAIGRDGILCCRGGLRVRSTVLKRSNWRIIFEKGITGERKACTLEIAVITSSNPCTRNYDARGHVEICGNREGNAVRGRVAAKKKEEKNRSEFTLTPANEREW